MGNFLDAPLTEKTTEVGQEESKRVYCAMSCMQGWRAQMEDDHIMTLSVPEVSAYWGAHTLPPPSPPPAHATPQPLTGPRLAGRARVLAA